jgi:hypothetical protein
LIGGLGGGDEYTEAYKTYLFETQKAFIEHFGIPSANIIVLGENKIADQAFVTDVSTAENITTQFQTLAGRVTNQDQVYIVLFGHGSYDGTHASLNIPRQDLNDAEFDTLVTGLGAGLTVFIHTGSASGPFAEALSGPDRIIITATRTGSQRNETLFPRFLIEALNSTEADLDKNGALSIRELFVSAAQNTDRWYESNNNLATEHALLEDTGDGQGQREADLESTGEGLLAGVTYLRRRGAVAAGLSAADQAELGLLLQQKETIEREIAVIKSRKSNLPEDEYYAQLESVFVRLARLNNNIEGRTGQQ